MKNLSLIILLSLTNASAFALNGNCTPGSVGTGFSGTVTYCAGAVATPIAYNYAECASGSGAATGISCTATWYYNTTNTNTISGSTVTVSGPTAFTSAAGVNGNLPTVTPNTNSAGSYYYFCVVTWTATGTCAGPFTTATKLVTINVQPDALTGTNTVCAGLTTGLTDDIAGGVWASSTTTKATVGTSGIVTGVAAGTTTISYTLGGVCRSTATVSVNALPAAISGTASVCTGLTTSLTDATAGGTWSSSNANASVGTGAGVTTGVTAGAATITYSLATGCIKTATVTINQSPDAITGTNTVCAGLATGLTDDIAGGVWASSTTAKATVGTSGIVTGVAAGTTTISYTLGGVCRSTATVTVNALPAVISGTASVCTGSTTSLTDATAGGTWSSSNANASVGAGAGVTTGVTAGTATITYSLATGCIKTATVTIHQAPDALTGANTVCAGLTTGLTDDIAGGVWASSATTKATVGTSGTVTGVAAGTATISYTLGGVCRSTATVSVNALPAAISGTASVCTGLTTSLTDATAGGTWSSSNANASANITTGVTTGVTAGTATVTYSLATGCIKTVTATINQAPDAITGTNTVCTGLTTGLTDDIAGGVWASSATTKATVSTSGIVSGIAAGTASISYTLGGVCRSIVITTVNALPAAITGTASVCTGLNTLLADATAGGTWSSSNANANVDIYAGTTTGVTAGTATITYSLATGCIKTATVTINQSPDALTGTNTVCTGLTTGLTDDIAGGTWASSVIAKATVGTSGIVTGVAQGTTMITYKLSAGCFITATVTVATTPAAILGANAVCASSSVTLTNASLYGTWASSNTSVATVGATSGSVNGITAGVITMTYATGCGANTTHTVSVNPVPAAISGSGSVCESATTTLTDLTVNGTWSSSNAGLASVGASTGIVTGVEPGALPISYILPTGCYATISMIVNSMPNTVTAAGSGVFCNQATITASNGGSGTIYFQGATSGGTSTSTPSASQIVTSSGTYYFRAINSSGCWGTEGSVAVTVNVVPAISYSVTILPATTGTLNDAATGGIWSSSDNTIATIGSGNGLVTGVSGGTTTISYTLSAGCGATTTLTVNSLPTISAEAIVPVIKGASCTRLHFHTTGSPTNYNLNWDAAAHAAGFTDIIAGSLDTLAQDTILHIAVPTTASAAVYTGTISVTVTGYCSRGSAVNAIINDSMNIYTFAGTGATGSSGNGGAATLATISHPSSVASDCYGNTYIADYDNGVVRKVDARGVITIFAGNGTIGYTGDYGPATSAELSNPTGVAIDGLGNVYISDYNNMVVRKVNNAGMISTFAGNGAPGYSGDGGAATSAELHYPVGLAVDNNNNVYIADYMNSAIRMVNTSGVINTVAGNGNAGYSGDGGSATDAKLSYPRGVAVDAAGNIYIADYGNNVIRKADASGNIKTVAGVGLAGYGGDGNSATLAQLNSPWGIAVDGSGDIYFSELRNNVVRKVDASGFISTIAGNNSTGFSGNGSQAVSAQLNQPMGISINCSGNMFIADNANFAIRVLGLYNRAPYFTGGATQTVSFNENSVANSLNSLLTVNDFDTTQAETWSIASGASNGALSISYATTSTGSTLVPSGLTYTPAPGFTGTDVFTIQISDGITTASTTVTVNVSGSEGRMSNTTTGVNNTTTNTASLEIFPNPTRGGINIKTSGAGTFYLYTMDGKVESAYTITDTQTSITIPNGLPTGIYIGRFKGADGSSVDVKLVYEQ